jgi:hypothetical protein
MYNWELQPSIWVFLAPRLFAAKPRLSALGFPWISLESLASRLINWLRGINDQKFFRVLLTVASVPPGRWLTILARGQARSLIGQAYPDFRFSAINCRPSRSTRHGQSKAAASSAEFYQAPQSGPGRADPAEIKGEVSHLASDTLDAGAEPACRQTRGEGRTDGDYRCVNLTDFSIMARWNHFPRSGLHGRLPGGGTYGRSSFSELPSPLSRVACRGSAAAHSSSTLGHRDRGFYRPISCCDPLDAGCDRTA